MYQNPVYSGDFPDPFILKFCGAYWAYSTGIQPDGRAFAVLHSNNLVEWRPAGSAMELLPGDHTCYWAPEVRYHNGRFYLYYSVGNEEHMHLRVAVARQPAGPFIDSGRRLTAEPFAIDPHLFEDDDGQRFLFYATDFLEHSHIGTGTVCDRLLDWFTLAGRPQPVTRARYEWQVYDPQRVEKGGVRWHTVEGPFVLKRKGRYYQMFSGGNWQNLSYGVSYATAERIKSEEEWEQACDGERVLPILRTIPGKVIGPGHNSVVRGPDNRQLYCVYHRWSPAGHGRLLAVDPLDWAGERLLVYGPTYSEQPAPLLPAVNGFDAGDESLNLGREWTLYGGQWQPAMEWQPAIEWRPATGTALQSGSQGPAEARYQVGEIPFLLEVSVRGLPRDLSSGAVAAGAGFGVALTGADGQGLLSFFIQPARGVAAVRHGHGGAAGEATLNLDAGFDCFAYHLLRVEVNERRVALRLDETAVLCDCRLDSAVAAVSLVTEDCAAAFAGFALTPGWSELFTGQQCSGQAPAGWQNEGAPGWQVQEQALIYSNEVGEGRLVKAPLFDAYEWVVNARLDGRSGTYGFWPALTAGGRGPLFTLSQVAGEWVLGWRNGNAAGHFPLSSAFDPAQFQQFRGRKQNGTLTIQWESQPLGQLPAPGKATQFALYAKGPRVEFDYIRLTVMP
jgi:GH43 family beta-xylosidase